MAKIMLSLVFLLSVSASLAQEYLSKCDVTSEAPCAKAKFLSCLSGVCQCEDSLNQVFDPVSDSCVIMAGRKCAGILSSAELLDPRRLEAVQTFPTCGSNAVCDTESSSCKCSHGYFHNETDGTCQLSFGMSCSKQDIIVFQKVPESGKRANSSTTETTFLTCQASLGLVCGSEGVCVCEGNSVWKLNTGCVPFNGSSYDQFGSLQISNNSPGNYMNHDYYGYYGGDEQTPVSKLIDAYTRALLEANNYYYFTQNNAELMGTRGSPSRENSTKDNLLGDRNQFPGNGGGNGVNSNSIQINQNDELWNYLSQQDQNRIPNNFRIPITNNGEKYYNLTDVPLKEQLVQLQKLLEQQKQLEIAVNSLFSSTNRPTQQNVPNQGSPNFHFPSPASLMALSHNLLGLGVANSQGQAYGNAFSNQYQYQQQPSLFGGPLFRYFRNLKRTVFPNWSESPYTFPSPIYLAAATIKNILPVLRAFDQQFSPLVDSIVTLTKPRPRAVQQVPLQAPAPAAYNNPNVQFTQQQQPWNNGRLFGALNGQPTQPNLGQRLFQGNGLFGLNGLNRVRSATFNNLGPTENENRRSARMRNFNENRNPLTRVSRGLWWG